MGILIDDAIIILKGINENSNRQFKTVISLGDPVFHFNYNEFEKLARSLGLNYTNKSPYKKPRFKDFFKNLNFKEFLIIDLNSSADINLDLNVLLKDDHEIVNRGDLIIDGGTSHYIFNVKNLFENLYKITSSIGCIYHSIGSNGYYDQAFYQFSPTLLKKVYENFNIHYACEVFPNNQRFVKKYINNKYYYDQQIISKSLITFFVSKRLDSKLNLNPQFDYDKLIYSSCAKSCSFEDEILYDRRSLNKKIRNSINENINRLLQKTHIY